ncbi:MAG: hypothetical protein IJ802_05970 [Kiritimatiellae bacterium]|nr:hypothetical protein [Kiritimatiellia bacterium]
MAMSNNAKNMKTDALLRLCWLAANEEAKHLGAVAIEPVHFLLGVLKIADPEFPKRLETSDVSSAEWAAMCKAACNIRHYLDIIPEKVADKRRRLRAKLAAKRTRPPEAQSGMLHRSKELKRAFHDACLFTDGDTLTLRTLVQSLFELELVSLDDIK